MVLQHHTKATRVYVDAGGPVVGIQVCAPLRRRLPHGQHLNLVSGHGLAAQLQPTGLLTACVHAVACAAEVGRRRNGACQHDC